MKFTLVSPQTDHRVDREYNAGLGAGFSIGPSIGARLLELMRRRMGEPSFMPFGYIAALLKQNGHEVVSSSTPPEDGAMVLAPSLANFKGDMAALKEAASLANVKTIVIGNLASAIPDEFALYANLVIKGEPDAIVRQLGEGNWPHGIVEAEPVRDLDSLPFPNWEPFKRKSANFSYVLRQSAYAFVQASRSCPYTCEYCPYITTGAYRHRSVKNVIEELKYLRSHFGTRAIIFRDPTFTLNRKWVADFCETLLKEGLDLKWECETRMDRLDKDLLRLMQRAGLNSVKVGIESADERVLRDVKRRPINLEHQETIVEECHKINVAVVGFYVLGLPTDTVETIEATISYAKRLDTDIARFHIFTPLPGTPLFLSMKDRIYETDWEKFDMFHVVFRHDNLTSEELYKLKEKAYLDYYFRPGYLARRVLAFAA